MADRERIPTLIRLTLRHAPAASALVSRAFSRDLGRLLAAHGLGRSRPCPRPAAPGRTSRLYAVDTPGQVRSLRQALAVDPAWQEHLSRLAVRGAADTPAAPTAAPAVAAAGPSVPALPWSLTLFSTAIGPGTRVTAGPGTRSGRWHTLTLRDGMQSAVVNYLFQDLQGCLWISTGDGLSRYDGVGFWHLTAADGLPHDEMLAVAQTPDGVLWFAANGLLSFSSCGLCRLAGETLEHYTAADGLPSDGVINLWVDPGGRLWVFTGRGPVLWTGEGFAPPPGLADPRLPPVLRACQDPAGRVWLATFEGLWEYDGARATRLAAAEGGLDGLVWSVLADQNGTLWAGGPQGACRRLPGGRFEPVALAARLESPFAAPLLADPRHGIWFATYPRGVCRLQDGQAQACTTAQGLPANRVTYGLLDRDGRAWFCYDGGGLGRYLGDRLTWIAPDQGLPDPVCSFLRQDRQGRLWLGTARGTARWDGAAWQTVLPTPDWHSALIDWLETPAGDRWGVAHSGQVLHCPAGQETWTESLPSPRYGHNNGALGWVPADPAGPVAGLWCANGSEALHRYHDHAWQTLVAGDGLPPGQVRALAVDPLRPGVYVGTTLGGVSCWDGRAFTLVAAGDAWDHRPVLHLFVDHQQRLWIGTEGRGVFWWDGNRLAAYTRAAGLAADRVLRIAQTREGHLVFCTQGGGASLFDGQVFQTFDRTAGLADEVVKDFLQDRAGQYWFATQDEITVYRPGTGRPHLRLGAVYADRAIQPAADDKDPLVAVAVPDSQRLVRLGLSSANLGEGSLVYRHRLVGRQDDWTQTTEAEVIYRELPLGEYRFEAQAVDLDLHYSEPVVLALRIVPDPRVEGLAAALRHRRAQGSPVGSSPAMVRLRATLDELAPLDETVLLLGQTGTGKTLAAGYLHERSQRRGAYIHVNCGTLPADLVDSALYGHEKGAFTGAHEQHQGFVGAAAGGTLFLDEIGEMPLTSQVRLLHLLDGRQYWRVGGREPLRLQARGIAATNRDLQQGISQGLFRADLFHRLNRLTVVLPPLAGRLEDLPELVACFLALANRQLGKRVMAVSTEAIDALTRHAWVGNLRDLANVVTGAVLRCRGLVLEVTDLFPAPDPAPAPVPAVPAAGLTRAQNERRHLLAALEECHWVIEGPRGAAVRLDVKPSTLRDLMAHHGLKRGQTGDLRAG